MEQHSPGSPALTRRQTIAALAMLGLGMRSTRTLAHTVG